MSRDFFVGGFFALFFADDDFFLELEAVTKDTAGDTRRIA